jgi:hypothetical protein
MSLRRRASARPPVQWDRRPFRILALKPFLTSYALSKIVVLDNGCWLWTGAKNNRGYANIYYKGKVWSGHKLTCYLLGKEIPDGKRGDHQCHDPTVCNLGDKCPHRACINPDHIEPATDKENYARSNRLFNQKTQTHCKRSHEYTPENTYIRPDGRRGCRKCKNDLMRRIREKRNGTVSLSES